MTSPIRRLFIVAAATFMIGPGCAIEEDFGGHTFDVVAIPSIGAEFIAGGYPLADPAGPAGPARDRVSAVSRVAPGSSAEQAGLKPRDIITGVDGSGEATPLAIRAVVGAKQPGGTLALQVLPDGRSVHVTIPIGVD